MANLAGEAATLRHIHLHQAAFMDGQLNGTKAQLLQRIQHRLDGPLSLIIFRPIMIFAVRHAGIIP